MTGKREYTGWDDGAASAIDITVQANATTPIVNGPLVLLGYSAHNTGAAATSLTWLDGGAGRVYDDQVGGTSWANRTVADRGVRVTNGLSVAVGANGPVNLTVHVRLKYRDETEEG